MSTVDHPHVQIEPADRARLGRRAQLLAAASVTYNMVEAAIAVTAGIVAGSVALIGFGLDSVVEVSSGLIILWQFRHRIPESRERRAQRLIAISFLALAAYVTYESVQALLGGANAQPSPVGIGLAIASLLIMPALSYAQRRTGRALRSRAVIADGTQTLLCAWLSAALLLGLLLNATLGWSWADPIAGLIIAAVAAREGIQTWRGDSCCAPAALLTPEAPRSAAGSDNCGCGPDCHERPGDDEDPGHRDPAGTDGIPNRRVAPACRPEDTDTRFEDHIVVVLGGSSDRGPEAP